MSKDSIEAGHLTRLHDSVLSCKERQLLSLIVTRLPAWVTPDHMTCLGVAGGLLVALGCIGANLHSTWLFLAILGLFINWLGDSTDGSLARHRRIERPRYGFFVDQFSDVLSHFLILFGLGLSPLMRLDTALLALLGSLAIMFYGHLKLQFTRTWQVSYYGIGPTELRILIGGGLVLGVFLDSISIELAAIELTPFDIVGVLVFFGALACIGLMFSADRATLARIDPPRGGIPKEVVIAPIAQSGLDNHR